MGQSRGGRRQTGWLICMVLLVMAAGVYMIAQVFDHSGRMVLEKEDGQLVGMAYAVDRSVLSYLESYAGELRAMARRPSVKQAVELWEGSGDDESLLQLLEESLMEQNPTLRTVLVLREGRVALSGDGEPGQWSGGWQREPIQRGPSICRDGSGTAYLAVWEPWGELWVASVVDLAQFYQLVAGGLPGNEQGRVMMMDATGSVLLHSTRTDIRVSPVERMDAQTCDYGGLELMLEREGADGPLTAFYEVCPFVTGTAYTARMAVLPASVGDNGFFSIGVSSNYDRFIRPIREAAIRLVIYGGVVIGGAVVLLLLALWGDRNHRRALREVAVLKEKNEAMEALNAKTLELAHHQRLETIGTLTSSIAHEFNNLLTPIMGYSILVLEKLSPEETDSYDSLLEIYAASCKAKQIISRLSDLSRKNTALTFQYIAPDEVVRRVLEVAAPARPPQVEVQTELNCRHLWIHANDTQLSQVLLNLVLNAFHAMEQEGGMLTLSTEATGDWMVFRIRDTGCGIPPEVLPHIFDPFFTTKESGKGTGLGLAIVRQVVDSHRGQVEVQTEVGSGTTFSVSFPLQSPEE